MLSLKGPKGSTKVAFSPSDPSFEVHIAEDSPDTPPAICNKPNLLSLLSDADWMRVIRKYKIKSKDVVRLKKFWSMRQKNIELDCPQCQMGFRALEDIMLRKLKYQYNCSKKLRPFMPCSPDKKSPNVMLVAGATSSGKGFWTNELLTMKDKDGNLFSQGRPIVFFAMDPEDESFAPTRKLFKKTLTMIDIDKMTRPLPLSAFEKGSIIVCDDVLSALDRYDPRRQAVLKTMNEIAVRGRHWTGTRGMRKRGCELIVLVHLASSRDLQQIRNACKFFTFFPKTNRSQVVHMLKSRLDFTKKRIENILKLCGNSRWLTFHLHYPLYCVHQHGVIMLNET